MHSLEPELTRASAAGALDPAVYERAVAIERRTLFSVSAEIRLASYAAVVLITTGAGIFVKKHYDEIGPIAILALILAAAAACYAPAVRAKLQGRPRSIAGEYILLLGALLLSAAIAFAESQFHLLGSRWSLHFLLLAVIHAAGAYVFDSVLLLSTSVTALTAWFGLDVHAFGLLDSPRSLAWRAFECAALLAGWRFVDAKARGGRSSFSPVFEHVAANLAFVGTIALCTLRGEPLAWGGLALALALAAAIVWYGWQRQREAFVIYGIVYAVVAINIVMAWLFIEKVGCLYSMFLMGTAAGAIVAITVVHLKMRRRA